ncbi:MAG TPA: histidine kinase [Egibacteraceae bacterium]
MTQPERRRGVWDAAAFLVARAVVGVGALALVAVALAIIGLALVAAVYAAVAIAIAVLIVTVSALVSGRVRAWLRRRPPWRVRLEALPLDRLAAAVVWWLLALRAIARRERAAVAAYRGSAIDVGYRPLPDGDVAQLRTLVADPATWRDLACLVVVPAVVLLACTVLGLLVVVALGVLLVPPTPDPVATSAWADIGSWTPSTYASVAAAAVALVAVPFLLRPLAGGIARLAAGLLSIGERARMRAELEEQRLRRQLAVEAAERERRRIERDLHDGAQQRLVSLGMHLGMARQALPDDPVTGAALVEAAHEEAKRALEELRDLARGIHPAILDDRGLDAALSALAGRSSVPVDISVELPRRPPTAVESAAYFVVAECLTNVTRHAAATSATVRIVECDGAVVVTVSDDGVGGADPARGTGLAGLSDRVAGLGGRLQVASPPGGPTTVTAEIPCAS